MHFFFMLYSKDRRVPNIIFNLYYNFSIIINHIGFNLWFDIVAMMMVMFTMIHYFSPVNYEGVFLLSLFFLYLVILHFNNLFYMILFICIIYIDLEYITLYTFYFFH